MDHVAIHHTIRRLYSSNCLIGRRNHNAFISAPRVGHRFRTSALRAFATLYTSGSVGTNTRIISHRVIPTHRGRVRFFNLRGSTLLLRVGHIHATSNRPVFRRGVFIPFSACHRLLATSLRSGSVFTRIRHINKAPVISINCHAIRTIHTGTRRTTRLNVTPRSPLLGLHTNFANPGNRPILVNGRCCIKSHCIVIV